MWEGKYTGEMHGDKGYFSKVCYANSSDKILQGLRIALLFLVQKTGAGRPSQREICALILGRSGKGTEFLPCLRILNCLHLKITLMPKLHILGWHSLILFICYPPTSYDILPPCNRGHVTDLFLTGSSLGSECAAGGHTDYLGVKMAV